MAKHQGLFIAFEGPDGSGKSTLARGLCELSTDLSHLLHFMY